MPNSPSAEKRVRQNAKRRAINRWRTRRVKGQIRTFLEAVHAGDVTKANEEFRKTCSVLDKISSTSTMHKNAAARRKSRLHRRLKEMQQKTTA